MVPNFLNERSNKAPEVNEYVFRVLKHYSMFFSISNHSQDVEEK